MFYLITVLAVKEYPTQLNDFRRILGDIYSMLVASCGNVDDHISVQLGNGDAIAGHVGEFDRGKRRLLGGCWKAALMCQCQTCSESCSEGVGADGCGDRHTSMPRITFRGRSVTNDGEPSLNEIGFQEAVVRLDRTNMTDTNSPNEVCNRKGEGDAELGISRCGQVK